MNINDLNFIFKEQIEMYAAEGIDNPKLFFMITDRDYNTIERCHLSELETLLPMLDCFQLKETTPIPKFVK